MKGKMSPPIITLPTIYGLALCLSGITHPLALSKEMADHERRRKAIKKLKFEGGEGLHADQELRSQSGTQRICEEIGKVEAGQDLVTACTAKAA